MIGDYQGGRVMQKRWLLGLLVGCGMALAAGSDHAASMKDAEASMLLTGTINVDPQGAVTGFTIDHRDKLPDGVLQLVDDTVPGWTFKPVIREGQPVPAKTAMSMLVVASQPDADHYKVAIKGATFGDSHSSSGKSLKAPDYPPEAYMHGVEGSVYLVLKIDRQGRVADAVVEQVNLNVLSGELEMNNWRRLFSVASLRVAKHWTFKVPFDTDQPVTGDFSSVRVPCAYVLAENPEADYGKWHSYVRGARNPIPWDHPKDDSPPDALVAGALHQFGQGLHLLTPLDQG